MSGNVTGQVFVPGLPGTNEEFIFDVGKNLHNYVGRKGSSRTTYQVVHGRHVYGIREVVRTQEIPTKVYNLHVEGTHTYTIRGTVVHNCFLLRIEDNMESIGRSINSALQLSKRGGGVALLLSNIREHGAPIKNIENQSSGVIPIMKLLEDSFSYANQLGARQGAGAVYLHAHHPDIYRFLDTKRENADEKIRIKTLSLGVVIPDITFELAKKNEDMYLFSPYDVERVYGVPFADISVTEKYYEMVDDARIRKTKIKAREFFQTLAELQFESGYPYIMYEDTVNRANPIEGKITHSNLCSEILQVSTPSVFNEDLTYAQVGKDISCNLGSLNIAKTMDSPDFAQTIEVAIRALTAVSDQTHIWSVPSIEQGNNDSHAIGLGQMNLHGYLARERIFYGSEEGVDFTNIYFYTVLYHALRASNRIAIERGTHFKGFEKSKYASGEFFDKYTEQVWEPKTDKVRQLFADADIRIPTQEDWVGSRSRCRRTASTTRTCRRSRRPGRSPTSTTRRRRSTRSRRKIEIRKEGKIGRVYYPAPYMTNDNLEYYEDAYEIGYEKIIDTYAAATQHVDQGLSLTLFFKDTATTRDVNKAQIYAWRKGIKTLYYIRLRQMALEGTEVEGCVSPACCDDWSLTAESRDCRTSDRRSDLRGQAPVGIRLSLCRSYDQTRRQFASGNMSKLPGRGERLAFYDWLRVHDGDDIVADELDRVEGLEELGQAEIVWIESLRREGHPLLNLSQGVWGRWASSGRPRCGKPPGFDRRGGKALVDSLMTTHSTVGITALSSVPRWSTPKGAERRPETPH